MREIEEYLKGIGIKNEFKNISDINKLIRKHLQALCFSNISILLGEEISLDLSDIIIKMIDKKKGGYCFEHNKLMYETLKYFGFEVQALFARVLNNQNIESPRTHRFTLLTYEGQRYIVDVGFSFMSPSSAIKLSMTPTKTMLEREYFVRKVDDNNFELTMIRKEGLYVLYSFDLVGGNEKDFEVANFYSYKHKNANFVNNLVLSKITDKKIYSLKNNSYHQIFKDEKDERIIRSQKELNIILEDEFAYTISDKESKYLFDKFIRAKESI